MPRFAKMVSDGIQERGHKVEFWIPQPRFFNIPLAESKRKWLGYIDQFIIFPLEVRRRLKKCPSDTLFVFTDHALGPWVPLVADRPHVIHCHDFLALKSALGQIPENPTSWTGRQYQGLIRRGFSKGKNFISVSKKTREDLHKILEASPSLSEVVYNGLNHPFFPKDAIISRKELGTKVGIDLSSGYFLHVGGNEWYKNRIGVIEIYNAWREAGGEKVPLLLVGNPADSRVLFTYNQSPYKKNIYMISGLDDEYVGLAYSGALVLIFPSLAEGFGWPIAEAMASGCPVITTNEAPMTEVGSNSAFYIPKRPTQSSSVSAWAAEGAKVLHKVYYLPEIKKRKLLESGLLNAQRFDPNIALNKIEVLYNSILSSQNNYSLNN